MDNQQCLLNEDYYDDYPGCKADRQKELQSGLPIKQVLTIWIIVLASTLLIGVHAGEKYGALSTTELKENKQLEEDPMESDVQ